MVKRRKSKRIQLLSEFQPKIQFFSSFSVSCVCFSHFNAKSLLISTITEESPAPAATQRPTRTKRNATKATNDAPAEPNAVNKDTAALIANSVAVVPQAIAATEQIVTKITTVTTQKTVKNSSGEQVSNEKQQQSQTVTKSSARLAASREANQNESNLLLEHNAKLKTSTPRAAAKDANNSFSNVNITNGNNIEDHAAFKEYKDAGEYWNKYPKTDYTYSKLSQHRREVKPGVIAMPNMSRRSLEHHHERVNQMIRRDPAQESFFRSRYEALTALRKRNAADSYYDSQDETDLSFGLNSSRSFTASSSSFFRRVITVITTFFSSIYYRLTGIFRREQPPSIYYARFAEPKKGKRLKIFGFVGCKLNNLIVCIQVSFDDHGTALLMHSLPCSVIFTWEFQRFYSLIRGHCNRHHHRVAKRRASLLAY